MIDFEPLTLVLSLGTAAVWLVVVVVAVWWLDRYDREPWPLVAAVFLWGGVAAPGLIAGLAPVVDSIFGAAPDPKIMVGVVAPIMEETLKGLGILLVVAFSRHFDNPTDGLVYGTAVGLGFAVTENAFYGVASSVVLERSAILDMMSTRTLLTAGVHVLASSALGAGLGMARVSRRSWSRAAWATVGLFLAISIHGGWNILVSTIAPGAGRTALAAIVGPLYLVYGLCFFLMVSVEHRILVRQLTDEVRMGVLPPWTAAVIPFYRRRIRSNWWPLRRERIVISRLLTKLAFRKEALAGRDPSKCLDGLEIVRMRERIKRILAVRDATGAG